MNIGLKIRERRKELRVTQSELAQRIGKSPQVISNWERGYTTGIMPNDLQKISIALDIPISFLVEEPQPPERIVVADKNLQRIIDNYPKLNEQAKATIDILLSMPQNYA